MPETKAKSVSIQYLPYEEEEDKSKVMEAGRFLFPGFTRLLEIAYKEVSKDRYKYLTGLEIDDLPEDKAMALAPVREKLAKHFGPEVLDPYNTAFWSQRRLELTKKNTFLNLDNEDHLLTYYNIRGGGYQEVAQNYEDALSGALRKRWYLVTEEDFAELSVVDSRKVDKAIAALVELDDKKPFEDMLLMHKVLITSDKGVTKESPKAMLYRDLSDFIHGTIVKTNKKATASQFLEAYEALKKDRKRMYVTAYVKDGLYFHFLSVSDDNQIKNLQTTTKYGATQDRAVQYLMNPANQEELDNLKERVEAKWKK